MKGGLHIQIGTREEGDVRGEGDIYYRLVRCTRGVIVKTNKNVVTERQKNTRTLWIFFTLEGYIFQVGGR